MQPDPKANILLVDDTPANLLALEVVLADLGQNLVKVSSGKEALRYLLQHDVAIILMDVQMPEMDGFETAELIHQRRQCRHTPIIFMTSYEQTDTRVFKGYASGAVDFIIKPFNPEVLTSKVGVFVELHRKTEQIKLHAAQMREIERKNHELELAKAKEHFEQERLREEIRLARKIQQQLFPDEPHISCGFDVSGASCPAEATGGDYFDYIPMPDGSLCVAIGDVSGHGFGPALLMAELRAYLRAFLLTESDLGEIVRLLNRALGEDAPLGYFATLFLARLDSQTRSVVYSSAGHVSSYVLSPNGDVRSILKSTGMPLAILPDGNFPALSVSPLEPGEVLVLLTDGILEAYDPDFNLFGIDRVLEVVRSHLNESPQTIVRELYSSVRSFCGSQSQPDDMTVIVIKSAIPCETIAVETLPGVVELGLVRQG